MKLTNFLLIATLLLYLSLTIVSAEEEVTAYYFYGAGCPHCAKMTLFLNELQEKYPSLDIQKLETYSNQENRELFEQMSQAYGVGIQGVPTIFIDEKVINGFNSHTAESIEQEVIKCLDLGCISPLEKTEQNGEAPNLYKKLTIPAVVAAAAVDAINPCAFAVLILLLTAILTTESRKKALSAGLAFTLAIFISYFLMGLGLYSAIQAAGITRTFYIIVAILAILIGLFNLKDYLWYGKWFIMEVPRKWRPKMKTIVKSATSVPGAFVIGVIISLFLLPCTSGPYIVILGLLAKATTRNYALLLLLLYNFIFILPMLIITLAIYFGFTTTEKAEEWRSKRLKTLHLIAGIIILLLGIGMIIGLFLGIL
ncbi:MAG: cytochrome c biogenesis protein CcdA [Candidatus Woesearchaeota archaeon]